MPPWLLTLLVLALGYLLGSIPFGLVLTKLTGGGDIRQIGSGNIGATNVLRTGRKGVAAATLLLDMAKGAAAVCIARMIGDDLTLIGGAGAFFGHLYPVWLGFKGGKGVATMLGIALAIAWPLGAIYAAVWLGMLAVTRVSSASGIAAALSAPIAAFMLDNPAMLTLAAFALMVVWKHADNIKRLIAGTEPKVGQKNA
jgi:acyl phosphate:glycerol-3-phosphate acyltransferase